jgi:hypothetical protein
MLIRTKWNQAKTFKLIPISLNSPYNEAIYDPQEKILAVISKEKKESFQLVPKFTDKGDIQYTKVARENGKNYAEERRAIESWYEYYIDDVDDMRAFVKMFAVNADDFDINQYVTTQVIEPPKIV